jgi:hypothetical protein
MVAAAIDFVLNGASVTATNVTRGDVFQIKLTHLLVCLKKFPNKVGENA